MHHRLSYHNDWVRLKSTLLRLRPAGTAPGPLDGVNGVLAEAGVTPPEPRKVAFVISIIEGKNTAADVDDALLKRYAQYIDGAAVVAQSVRQSMREWEQEYPYELVAMVSAEAPFLRQYEPKLRAFGWNVRYLPMPLRWAEIEESYYKNELNQSGCCGMSELLKVHAFSMEEYHRVMVMDTDVVVSHSMEEIFALPEDITLVYTNGSMEGEQFQGGWWVVRPSMRIYNGMVDMVRRGRWFKSTGWEESNIGWFYGGPTIQGLLPYWFFMREAPEARLEVSRCVYNCQAGQMCGEHPIDEVSLFHFTQCPKPWSCIQAGRAKCYYYNDLWWAMSRQVEHSLGLEPRPRCKQHGYHTLELNNTLGSGVFQDGQ